MNNSRENIHALSFDIEDWFHLVEIKACEDSSLWSSFPSIVEKQTREILVILETYQVRATFFILGWVAERHPSVVRMIADEGHEIGTHSFWHRKIYELTPDTFQEDLADSIDVIEQHAGVKVRGFRAPSFSITPGTEWAFEVIKKVGLEYDASLFPAPRAHGGYPCDPKPHRVSVPGAEPLAELPMSTLHWGPLHFGFSGGGYFRLWPTWVLRHGMNAMEREGRPAVVYIHPRDFPSDSPRVRMPMRRRFKCYVGQKTTERKLRWLLEKYRFTTCRDVLKRWALLPTELDLTEANER